VTVEVIETGSLNAKRSVEVKSRVSGRVKALYVDEGDLVYKGQVIAEIDPQETQLQVAQNLAQVRGAEAGVRRQSIEISQRRVSAQNALVKAQSNLRQVEMELRIQPTLTRSGIDSSEAAFAQANQAYEELRDVTQPNARTAAEVNLRDAQVALENANLEIERTERLLEEGYVSRRDAESARLQKQLAESKLRTAKENLDRLSRSQSLELSQAKERVRQAKSTLTQSNANTIQDRVKREQYLRAVKEVSDARNQVRDIEAMIASRDQQLASVSQLRSVLSDGQRQLGETRIVAPLDGIVTKRAVQVGELVSSLNSFSAGTTIVKIEDRSQMLAQLSINEIDVAKLQLGTSADVLVDAFPDESFKGKVTKIAPTNVAAYAGSTEAVVKYEVEVTLDSAKGKLKSGMSAKCTMKVVNRKAVARLPVDYVGKDAVGYFVTLPGKQSKEGTRKAVTVGAKSTTHYEIVDGVVAGTKVLRPKFNGPARKGMMDLTVSGE
jgi:HlyD family secretion protein